MTTETQHLPFDSFDPYWHLAESGAIRIDLMLRELSDPSLRNVRTKLRERLARFEAGGRLVMPGEAVLVAAQK